MTFLSTERLRKLRGVGWRAAFGLVVFVVAFYLSFPYGRVKDQVVAMAAQRDLDVEIASAGPILGMGMAFKDVSVAKRSADAKRGVALHIDEARVHLSPLARLLGENGVSVSADALGGDVDVDWEASKAKTHLRIKSQDLALAQVPGVKEAINLPLGGKLGLAIDLTMAAGRAGDATGSVRWSCDACAVGDGKSKLKVASNPMLAEGLSLPRVRLGDFTGRVVFEKGVGKLQAVQAHSPDGEVEVEGEIRLADPLPYSQLDLYVRFKPSDSLLKSSDKLQLIFQLIDSMGKRPDGAYGLRLTGSFNRLGTPQWSKTSPFTNGAPSRPVPTPHVPPGGRPTAFAPMMRTRPAMNMTAEPPVPPPPPPPQAAATPLPPTPPPPPPPAVVVPPPAAPPEPAAAPSPDQAPPPAPNDQPPSE